MPSDETLSKDIIGKINVNKCITWKMNDENRCQLVDLQQKCIINLTINDNNNNLIVSTINNQLIIYDEYFNQIKLINRINNQIFYPFSVLVYNQNYYICDSRNNRVLMTDENFNLINEFGSKKRGSALNQLNNPYDICIYQKSLLVCDNMNFRIQRLSLEQLLYEKTYKIEDDDYPLEIKCYHNTLCVRKYSGSLSFFELMPSFQLKITFKSLALNTLCIYNSYFYAYSQSHEKLYCFEMNGILIKDDELKINCNNDSVNSMIIFNNKLIISINNKFLIIN